MLQLHLFPTLYRKSIFAIFAKFFFILSKYYEIEKKGGKNMKRGKDMASKKFCCKVMIIAI